MVGEVTFTDSEQALDRSLQFVVNPDTAHCVVDGRVNHHRVLIGAYVGDFFIHIEEVTVALSHNILAQTVDCIAKVEEYGQAGIVYAEAFVTTFFGGAAGNVARNEVTECWITAFQVVVAVFLRNIFSL